MRVELSTILTKFPRAFWLLLDHVLARVERVPESVQKWISFYDARGRMSIGPPTGQEG